MDPSQPTRTSAAGDAAGSGSFLPSIEEGRFPAGTTLAGRFRILGLLGSGGMGEVYRALDLTLNQPVALKFVLRLDGTSDVLLARFRNEVRIARQVSHPNVCRVYDIGIIEGLHFLSMEYVDGEDLASLLRRIGRLPSDKALEFARRICAGLAAAHERGVLHRDLKPANIMIDGRGQVRITDFGLAALASDVHGSDIRSGTPAYMSPEQTAGKEVTTRSDIYALGLVLHEMFTGKRPGESHATPTTLVKDLDPAIERVILRCLDADPRNRPASALNVAMALPGGDPIAAALAAGETPSPEMVAASAEKEGLQPRTAVACGVGVAALLVALLLVSGKTTLLGRAPLPLPPDALAFKARELLKQFGYTEEPVDAAYGFSAGPAQAYLRYVRTNDAGHQWPRLASHQPALTTFWYRQHQQYLVPVFFFSAPGILLQGLVTPLDPPPLSRGMVRISLDATGRLDGLIAMPSRALSQTPDTQAPLAVNWAPLFSAAGLDAARFAPTPPVAFMPAYADSRMAWVGAYGEGRPDQIHVEAAALNGRPVFFRIYGPWLEEDVAAPSRGQRLANVVSTILLVVLLSAAGLVGWRNVHLGRGDKRAAWRVAALLFAVGMVTWALVASHVPTQWETYLLVMGLSLAGFQAGFFALLYLAVEPFVRRHWPDALISWLRMVSGRVRDPLAMSHILLGLCAGLVFAVLTPVPALLSSDLTNPPSPQGIAIGLSGVRYLFGILLIQLNGSVWFATGVVLVLVLLRGLTRRTWVADALFVMLISLLSLGAPTSIPVEILRAGTIVWVLRRFGLLALVAMTFANGLFQRVPAVVASWYAWQSLIGPIVVAAVAAWSLYVILTSRPGIAPAGASYSPARS